MEDQESIVEHLVVDDRVFLLGLDELYREAMKPHERGELLECALEVAYTLTVDPANVPVEGYYAEDESLTLYFQLMRALQAVHGDKREKVEALGEFRRLQQVTGSRIYGVSQAKSETLLPQSLDALGHALLSTRPDWNLDRLIDLAFDAAHELDDFSLGGLASLAKDPVILAALRESVVLYLERVLAGSPPPIIYEYEWRVDDFLVDQARRFIKTFEELFGDELPKPEGTNVEVYWHAAQRSNILGRCVRLGYDNRVTPVQHYHWAICARSDGREVVQEFWTDKIWTTEMYREKQDRGGGCLEF